MDSPWIDGQYMLEKSLNTVDNVYVCIYLTSKNGIANTHEKYRGQDRDPGWLGHILAR